MCGNKFTMLTFTIFVSKLNIAVQPRKYGGNSNFVSRPPVFGAGFLLPQGRGWEFLFLD